MLDDIVKALTIQIKANDLTGETFGNLGAGIKEIWGDIQYLNKAWEAGGKIFDVAWGGIQKGIETLSIGGEFAEVEAAFNSLAKSFKVDGQDIALELIMISGHTLSLAESMKMASNAIRQNFGEEQIRIIAAFSKKYSEAVGEDYASVFNRAIDAIAQGKVKAMKDLGIIAQEGSKVSDILDQMKRKTEQFGDGAFNFGDDWQSILTGLNDLFIVTAKEMNNLLGEDAGYSRWIEGVRSDIWGLVKEAPTIGYGIFKPIFDIGSQVLKLFTGPLDALFVTLLGNTDNATVMALRGVQLVGDQFYHLLGVASGVFNVFAVPVTTALGGWLDMIQLVGEETGVISTKNIEKIKALKDASYNFGFDLKKQIQDRIDFNAAMEREIFLVEKGRGEHKSFGNTVAESTSHIKKMGEGFEKEKKAKSDSAKASKELSDETKELAKTYDNLGKSFEGTIKTMGDVVNKTQEGINSTASGLVDYIKTADMFTFGSSQKKSQIEAVMEDLQQQKAEEMRVLEKSADAQIELAKAYTQFANTPRKVELSTSGNGADILLAFVNRVIDTLNELSYRENTPVLGVA